MKKLEIQIKLISPIIISEASGDSTLTKTLSYIPGSTMLGLIANLFIKTNGKNDFDRLFMMGGLRFLNLYPMHDNEEYLPCPMNIWASKSDPNNLVNMFEHSDDNLLQLKRVGSFASVYEMEKTKFISLFEPRKKLYFHHERDYDTGISKESKIFTYEALDPEQTFKGSVLGKQEDLLIIKDLLDKNKVLRIGKSKTAQYGKTELISAEIKDFEQTQNGHFMFLKSDMIIKNINYSSVTDLEAIEKILGVKIENCFMETGKNEVSVSYIKAKKPVDYVIKAGSVFELKSLPAKIDNMKLYGIGERRWEGFGDVAFMTFKDSYSIKKNEDIKPIKPNTSCPQLIKDICQKTLHKIQKVHLESHAVNVALSIDRCISKSLASRLEGFASSGRFEEYFQQLRKISKDALKKCYVDNQTLYNYLKEIDKEIKKELKATMSLKMSSSRSIEDFMQDFALVSLSDDEAKRAYLNTFFLTLRRSLKKDEKKGGNNE